MRTLTLMRHAKSDWTASAPGEPPLPDKDRPLSRRGKRDAPLMATWMAANGLDPDLIICSTAVRTRQTLALTKETIHCERQIIQQREDLYLAQSDDLIERVLALLDDFLPAVHGDRNVLRVTLLGVGACLRIHGGLQFIITSARDGDNEWVF